MSQRLLLTTVVVRDYDEALDFYVGKLGFTVRQDEPVTPEKRWVVVGPPGGGAAILLAKAVSAQQAEAIGNQAGGRVFLFLATNDFERDHALYRTRGVLFVEEPRHEPYGMVAVFEDLYGNRWDLLEHAEVVAAG